MNSHDTTLGRSVDPQSLEVLGKQAARVSESAGISLTDAVVQTIGHVKLNSHQVRRVVEFANVEAYNSKFAATQGTTRTVHLDGGPADPVQVLQTLNDAARPREVVVDSLEYSMPPDLMKTSGVMRFDFTPERTRAGTLGEVYALESQLKAAHDELVQSYEAAKECVTLAFNNMIDQVKSASLNGATPDEILMAWHRIHPELAKIAHGRMTPLMRSSNVKVAGRSLNPDSAVVSVFNEFVSATKSAQAHARALQNVEAEILKVSGWLKKRGGV